MSAFIATNIDEKIFTDELNSRNKSFWLDFLSKINANANLSYLLNKQRITKAKTIEKIHILTHDIILKIIQDQKLQYLDLDSLSIIKKSIVYQQLVDDQSSKLSNNNNNIALIPINKEPTTKEYIEENSHTVSLKEDMNIDFINWEKDMDKFLVDNKLDVSLVLYRYPRNEIINEERKKILKAELLSKLKEAKLIISFLSYTKNGFELGATQFESRYEEWAFFLGWKIKKEDYFDPYRSNNNVVSITFKGLGGSDDEFINTFGSKLSSEYYSHFKRTIDDDGIRSGNVKLFFTQMPMALYLKNDRIFRLGNLEIKYFISFNVICNHCCLKGHREPTCPFTLFSKSKLNTYLIHIHRKNPIFVDVSEVPVDMNILENQNVENTDDLTTLRIFIRAKNERRIRQSKEQSKNQRLINKSRYLSPIKDDKGRVS
jgi:hypothetical protein